ncbi:MAG TPA: FAD-dependent monooxygenase [Trebonia sp.]|nr:FAD-dependent monooxygenase [Trebonia sp.]
MRAVDTDVLIVGAGPSGLMLAGELGLAGRRPLVLEKRPVTSAVERSSGIGGQALAVLRYRGLLDRFKAASPRPELAASFPFGSLHIDLSQLPGNPMRAMPLPQPELVRLLAERAAELGATISYGQEVTGISQDADRVTVDVRGPDGPYRVAARYVVGCDGGRSRVREATGIPFPGTTYPEVNRMGTVAIHDSVTVVDGRDFDVPGVGVIPFGYTHTDRGLLAVSARDPETMIVYTTEDDLAAAEAADSEEPMSLAELAASVRRVLGADLPMGEPIRLTRFAYQARQAARYREGRVLLAGDAAHLFPAGGQGIGVGVLDAVNLGWKLAAVLAGWGPAGLLDTYHRERHPVAARALMQCRAQVALRRGNDAEAAALRELFEELLTDEPALRRIAALIAGTDIRYPMPGATAPHPLAGTFAPDLTVHTDQGTTTVADLMQAARPVLLDLGGCPEARTVAQGWPDRVDVITAKADDRPADLLLIRPDGYIAWAAVATATVATPAAATAAAATAAVATAAGSAAASGSAAAGGNTGTGTESGLREALCEWFGAPRTA